MNSFQAHTFNAFMLLVFGMWGALDSYDEAGTAMQYLTLVLPAAGVMLLILAPWVAKQKNRSMLISCAIIALVLVYLYRQLLIAEGEPKIRVLVMALSCVWALIMLIKDLISNKFKKSNPTETELPL